MGIMCRKNRKKVPESDRKVYLTRNIRFAAGIRWGLMDSGGFSVP
jgi:hypothetical protein